MRQRPWCVACVCSRRQRLVRRDCRRQFAANDGARGYGYHGTCATTATARARLRLLDGVAHMQLPNADDANGIHVMAAGVVW